MTTVGDASVAVRGRANADVDPEVARVLIGISAREKDRPAAVESLAKADAAVWAVLSEYARAVERSRSDGIRVWGESERPAEPAKRSKKAKAADPDSTGRSKRARPAAQIVSYAAQVWYEITVGDFTVLDEMLTELAELQSVELAGPSWALRANSGVYRMLRAEAVRDARGRAEEYAEAAGATLTGLIELADDVDRSARTDELIVPAQPQGADETRPSWVIQPARQSVSVSVDARFSMSQPYFP